MNKQTEKYEKEYLIRRLDYSGWTLLEQLVRTRDIELDDFIITRKFRTDHLPSKWYIEIKK